ncbi:hypothetical protein GQ42DRAFT_90616 [Ramicandelaber brevisporus]|nr:hypothetical protein GQ42DRAFT_90616 [Ramicandelaber brevisporus]
MPHTVLKESHVKCTPRIYLATDQILKKETLVQLKHPCHSPRIASLVSTIIANCTTSQALQHPDKSNTQPVPRPPKTKPVAHMTIDVVVSTETSVYGKRDVLYCNDDRSKCPSTPTVSESTALQDVKLSDSSIVQYINCSSGFMYDRGSQLYSEAVEHPKSVLRTKHIPNSSSHSNSDDPPKHYRSLSQPITTACKYHLKPWSDHLPAAVSACNTRRIHRLSLSQSKSASVHNLKFQIDNHPCIICTSDGLDTYPEKHQIRLEQIDQHIDASKRRVTKTRSNVKHHDNKDLPPSTELTTGDSDAQETSPAETDKCIWKLQANATDPAQRVSTLPGRDVEEDLWTSQPGHVWPPHRTPATCPRPQQPVSVTHLASLASILCSVSYKHPRFLVSLFPSLCPLDDH